MVITYLALRKTSLSFRRKTIKAPSSNQQQQIILKHMEEMKITEGCFKIQIQLLIFKMCHSPPNKKLRAKEVGPASHKCSSH